LRESKGEQSLLVRKLEFVYFGNLLGKMREKRCREAIYCLRDNAKRG
jgi:hypothetical protein